MSKSMMCKLLDGQMVIVTCSDTEGRCLLLDGDEREILDISGIERFEVDDGYIDASWNKRTGCKA